MNSRQRILAAFDHQTADQVPGGFGDHRSGGISAVAYARLRSYLGLPQKPIRVYDVIQMLAAVDDDVLDFLDTDSVGLDRAFSNQDTIWHEWQLPDGSPCLIPVWINPERQEDGWMLRSQTGRPIARMPANSPYFDQTYFPLQDGRLPQASELPAIMEECMWSAIKIPAPGPHTPGSEEEKLAIIREFRQNTDRAIIGMFGSSFLERGCQLFRHDNFYMLIAAEPEKAHAILSMLADHYLEALESFLGKVGPYIDIIQFGDDLGMQSGPQISPHMYRKLFKPYHQKIWRRAKELADVKVMLHSCGSIRPFLPDLIDAGIDAINPVQISARDMDTMELKREFGDQLVFWGGGCDTQQVLPHGTEEEIRQHVRRQIEGFAPDGGFVFAQVHNIQADVPPQNIVAMIEAFKEYRKH